MKEVANRQEDKLFNFRPALFAAIFLILGIAFAYYQMTEELSLWWLTAFLSVVALTLAFSEGKKSLFRRAAALAALAVFFVAGAFSFRSQIENFKACPTLSGEVTVLGTVENSVSYEYSIKVVLTDISVGEKSLKGRLIAYLPTSDEEIPAVGDRLVLSGYISTDTDILNDYGVRGTAIGKKIYYELDVDEWVNVGKSKDITLLVRARMEEVIYAGMDESPASLTLALLTGDSGDMDEGLMTNMRYGGISHIFAVSGLNVGALFGFCLLLFAKTPLRRSPKWARFVLVVGILLFYCGICGFSASVVRAAIMCAVGYFVRLFGVGYDLLNSLGAAGVLILLINPVELFGVGFQLSFLACLGLALLTKPIGQVFDECKNLFRKRFPRRYTEAQRKILKNGDTLPLSLGEEAYRGVKALLSASLAAQIVTAPVLLLRFDYLSGWSLLLNFIFVPFTDGIFTILLVMVAVCCLLPTAFSKILLYLPSVVWSGAMLVFETVDFSSFALSGVQLSLLICVCYYGGVLFLSDKVNLKKEGRAWLALLFFAVCLAGMLSLNS